MKTLFNDSFTPVIENDLQIAHHGMLDVEDDRVEALVEKYPGLKIASKEPATQIREVDGVIFPSTKSETP